MSIQIELVAPQTVNARRVAWQSLWLLVRLYYLQRFRTDSRVLRLAELRQQFPDTRNLRMCVSRAFKDFAAWGIKVGWGDEIERDPRLLNPDGRSQGPFWLPPDEANKIECLVEGMPASEYELADFLGMERASSGNSTPSAGPHDADFWLALAGAQQALREGRLLNTLGQDSNGMGHGALAGFKDASQLAQNHLQQSLAVLGEASVWRRLDDLGTARQTLAKLRRALKELGPGDSGYLDAMEQVLTAWCAYSQRDIAGAEAILAGMRKHSSRDLVVRYHPRIRFEWHNLSALIGRAHALAGNPVDRGLRARHAEISLEHFNLALQAAFELGSFDAAQQVAANTGMAIWLFGGELLLTPNTGKNEEANALRWLLFSEWLCRCAGAGGHSAWNAIYLLRIARAKCPKEKNLPLKDFLGFQPIVPQSLALAAGSSKAMDLTEVIPPSWYLLASQLYGALQQGKARYSLLQRCGVLLEYGWYAMHAGHAQAAGKALGQLNQEIGALPPSDRAFFAESLDFFPKDALQRAN